MMAAEDDPKFDRSGREDLDGGRTMLVRTMEADDDGNVVEEVVIVSHRHRSAQGHAVREG